MPGNIEEQALYLKDSYLKEFEATVASVKDGKFVVLDRTAFYPNSGGQPHDTGKMTANGKTHNVVYVGKFGGNISHEVDGPGLKPGDKVSCAIDWNRRYQLMRMHTASHIISQVIHRDTGAMITGNQLDVDRSRIDFSVEEFDREKLKGFESEANSIVCRKLNIELEFIKGDAIEEALKRPDLTKLARGFTQNFSLLRIVKIGDFDIQADGGTHVKNTNEVGKIEFVDFVNKGKNNRRIYFRLGKNL